MCSKEVGKIMINKKQGGKIINISSWAGKSYVQPNYGAYSTSKFAIRGLTQVLAKELGTVMINSILSSPKTPLRAIMGTTANAYLNEVATLFSKIPKIANAIISATNADAFSIAQNNGKAAKQIIPHVHIHIIPRYNETGTLWTKRKIMSDNELNELAEKIKNCF